MVLLVSIVFCIRRIICTVLDLTLKCHRPLALHEVVLGGLSPPFGAKSTAPVPLSLIVDLVMDYTSTTQYALLVCRIAFVARLLDPRKILSSASLVSVKVGSFSKLNIDAAVDLHLVEKFFQRSHQLLLIHLFRLPESWTILHASCVPSTANPRSPSAHFLGGEFCCLASCEITPSWIIIVDRLCPTESWITRNSVSALAAWRFPHFILEGIASHTVAR